MLSIVTATSADIPLIRELTMQVWPPTYVPIIGEQQVEYMLGLFYTPAALEKQMTDGHNFIICYSTGVPVAFGSWSQIGPGIYKLHKLYILTGQQGQGIGKYMISYISTQVKKEGGSALLLNVNKYNHAAKAFYSKTGFTHLADEDINIGSGYFMNDHILQLTV